MAETTAHLVDEVIPQVPVRQWVLSFPIPVGSKYLSVSRYQYLSICYTFHNAFGEHKKVGGIKPPFSAPHRRLT